MKNKKLIKYILLCAILITSCRIIDEKSVIVKVKVNRSRTIGKEYYVITDNFRFYTDRLYNIGDTVYIKKNIEK